MTGRKYTAYLCSHTHWDREWYGSFEQNRMRLVRLIDRLMAILEADPSFRCFNLDGQTIILEDYLEIKPEHRPRLEKLIREGRICIGPWYILPDEWLASGESTIRSMLRAQAICRDFGVKGCQTGYLPDMFGHISQMPQLLRSLGFDKAIIWRGLSGDQWKAELWWEAPDGSRVLAFHLPDRAGYGNAALFFGSIPVEARKKRPEARPGEMATEDTEFSADALSVILEYGKPYSVSNQLLLMNGVDHMEPQPQIPEIIRRANEKLQDTEILHSSFEEFMLAVQNNAPADLQVVRGEMRSTSLVENGGATVLPNIISSRIYLKQSNAACQTLLERWTEPLASAAAWIGLEYPQGLINTAWKHLLRNHPHDSIGGCSHDLVHRDMESRFSWVQDIGENLASWSMHQITESIRTEDLPEDQLAWFVFNPLNWEVSDLIVADVDVDESWLAKHGIPIHNDNIYRSVRNLKITDWAGAPVDFEVLDIHHYTQHRPWIDHFGPTFNTVRFRVALWAEKLPPLGYKGYRVGLPKRIQRLNDRHGTAFPARMQNEHLTVEVQPNGTLKLSGAALGNRVLENVHYFENGGDNGDGYTYSPPRHDEIVTSLGGNAQITRLHDEAALQAIAVDYSLELPAGVTPDRQHRTRATVTAKIRSVFRLGAGSRRIDVETTMTNVAADHRLRVCFNVPEAGDSHVAESQFDVVQRANWVAQPSEDIWVEDMPLEHPQQTFMSYSNLAVANCGLPEYEVVQSAESVIKLTLLRAVNFLGAGPHPNTIVNGAGPVIETPDQQMIGRSFTFRYSIIPHDGDWLKAGVHREAHQHGLAWQSIVSGRHAGFLAPEQLSFMDVGGENILISAVKKAETAPRAYIARFWNCGDKASAATLKWFRRPASVHLSNVGEEVLEPIALAADNSAQVAVKPKQIVTVRFDLAAD